MERKWIVAGVAVVAPPAVPATASAGDIRTCCGGRSNDLERELSLDERVVSRFRSQPDTLIRVVHLPSSRR
jgi:hypothetical protein